jgi:quinol monooxygenase YgiN
MIRHTVVFRLKHAPGSAAECDFLQAAYALANIEGVRKFECLRQVSAKNPYTFGLSMEFADAAAYSFYSDHPDHSAFVQQRWIPEVEEFMEIDYEAVGGL